MKRVILPRGERFHVQLLDSIVGRMADIAAAKLREAGFCTDDDFKAAGFSAKAINAHGDRARHRAAHAMAKERNSALAGTPGSN
mgnify:CR=1 FL=1